MGCVTSLLDCNRKEWHNGCAIAGSFMQIGILLFAILSLAGAWTAWRRSPLYSHKITIKLVAVFLAIVGVILGGSGLSPSSWVEAFAQRSPVAAKRSSSAC